MAVTNTLLIIDDDIADFVLYQHMLDEVTHGFDDIVHVESLDAAHEYLRNTTPACCLLDYRFPDGSAKSLLERLQRQHELFPCPIVIITSQEDTKTAVELLHLGAQDYLVKQDITAVELQRAIEHAIKTWSLQKQLNHLALHDPLTGLVNRKLFVDRLSRLFNEYDRYQHGFSLVYIDLDRFKPINDTYGHEAGDFLLKKVAQFIHEVVRNTDTAARLGGDEFAVILPEISEAKAFHVAHKLVQNLTRTLSWRGHSITISPSLGLTCYPSKATNVHEFMREADMALYRAKESGRGRYAFFNDSLDQELREHEHLGSVLPRALVRNKLQLVYQPIFDLAQGNWVSSEALVRWHHEGTDVPPRRIIDLITEKRLAVYFHSWLFECCTQQLHDWQTQVPDVGMAVNVMPEILHDTRIMQTLLDSLSARNIAPGRLTLEMSESDIMRYPEQSAEVLTELRRQGFRIAIDDFGSSYSSMEYLSRLPADILKIDQKFFAMQKHAGNDTNERAEGSTHQRLIVAATALGHSLAMHISAEGLESEEAVQLARRTGCDYGQGYWLGIAQPADTLLESFHAQQFRSGTNGS